MWNYVVLPLHWIYVVFPLGHSIICNSLSEHIHLSLADVSLSSDFIAGFCGETEEEHQDTLSLLNTVKYDMAYMFSYSMRKVEILQDYGA